jgi:hypothetical protein
LSSNLSTAKKNKEREREEWFPRAGNISAEK